MEKVIFECEPNKLDILSYDDKKSFVIRDKGYPMPGRIACNAEDTGNWFIIKFPAQSHMNQDYYVCLDYSQARDLVLVLSPFKKELGFK